MTVSINGNGSISGATISQQTLGIGIYSSTLTTAATTQRTWTFPDTTGIVALVSNIPTVSITTPAALGAAAIGSLSTYAKADHVHAFPTLVTSLSATGGYATIAQFNAACSDADFLTTTGNAASATTATTATTANALNVSNAYTGLSFSTSSGYAAQFGGSAAVGFYVDGTNIAIRAQSTGILYFQNASGAVIRASIDASSNFSATGNVTAYSDERLKTNWRNLPVDFIQKMSEVKVGVYDRTDVDITQVGVSAQSLQTVLPEAVLESEEGMLSVSYGNAALATCIALAKEVQDLKTRLAVLESK